MGNVGRGMFHGYFSNFLLLKSNTHTYTEKLWKSHGFSSELSIEQVEWPQALPAGQFYHPLGIPNPLSSGSVLLYTLLRFTFCSLPCNSLPTL